MRASARLAECWFWLSLCACGAPPLVEQGGRCHSLSDCEPGLTCVAGRCSTDLSSLMGQIPSYDMAEAAAGQGAALDVEAGAPVHDAAYDAAAAPDAAPEHDAAPVHDAAPEAGPADARGSAREQDQDAGTGGAPDDAAVDS
jgi:hypothetical protein